MPSPVRRAEGLPAGVLPIVPWRVDPVSEPPGRRLPMFVVPPPARTLLQRVLAAMSGLAATIGTGAGLMVLAAYLATPG